MLPTAERAPAAARADEPAARAILASAEATGPARALKASLAASGLLLPVGHGSHGGELRHADAWSAAQAVHQGDRLLRTAGSMLSAHARAHGDHCSLWAADGPDLVAVLCEPGVAGQAPGGQDLRPGRRVGVATGPAPALDLDLAPSDSPMAQVQTPNPSPSRWPDPSGWTARMRAALGHDANALRRLRSALIASVVPWAPFPMVLMTIASSPSRGTRPRSEHARRHASLGMGLAWGLDAVVR